MAHRGNESTCLRKVLLVQTGRRRAENGQNTLERLFEEARGSDSVDKILVSPAECDLSSARARGF